MRERRGGEREREPDRNYPFVDLVLEVTWHHFYHIFFSLDANN